MIVPARTHTNDSLKFYEKLPPVDPRKELKTRLLESPSSLIKFFLQAIQDNQWIGNERRFAYKLFKQIQIHTLKKKIAIEKGVELMKILFSEHHKAFLKIVARDVTFTDTTHTFTASSLVLMSQLPFFQQFFLSEKDPTAIPVQTIAPELTAKTLHKLSKFMEEGGIELADAGEQELWLLLKQCHEWNYQAAVEDIGKNLKRFIVDPITALESITGAHFYGLTDLEICCLEQLNESRVNVAKLSNRIQKAYLLRVNYSNIDKIAKNLLEAAALGPQLIRNVDLQKILPSSNRLDCISVIFNLNPKERSLTFTHNIYTSERIPLFLKSLKHEDLREEPLSLSKYPLRKFDLRSSVEMSLTVKRAALGFIKICSGLADLRIRHSDSSFLKQVILIKPPLENLDIGHCSNISDHTIKEAALAFQQLTALNLKGTNIQNGTLELILEKLKHLTGLNLSYTEKLQKGALIPFKKVGERFKVLSLKGYAYPEDMEDLNCPNLEVLSIAHIRSFNFEWCFQWKNLKNLKVSVDQEKLVKQGNFKVTVVN